MGAEADATWLVDRAGQEATYCCINAVLRDYARLGLLLAHDGNWRGRQIIPAAWIEEAARVQPEQAYLKPGVATPFFGYGYQTGSSRGSGRCSPSSACASDDPRRSTSRLVMVHTAVRKQPSNPGPSELGALWRTVMSALGS